VSPAAPAWLIDELMPRFDEVERHALVVPAAPADVYAALRRVDLRRSWIVRALTSLRGLPSALAGRRHRTRAHEPLTLERMASRGFTWLGERPGRELALGVVGRFWTPTGQVIPLDGEAFRAFECPGYAKAVWDFRVTAVPGGGARLSTETRILCLDAASRRRFRRYWRVIRPFSGLIRVALLRAVAREARERTP
jgi:hypothetical protein